MTRSRADTPLMRQYRAMKAQHPDAILFFRVGDFYEMFYEDAEEGSRLLGLTLTSRNSGAAADVPLAGIPAKALDEYLGRLLRLGRRVAICEQVEDPAEAKGIVRREVVETVTPGIVFADALLSAERPHYVAAVAGDPANASLGLAWADVSTGEFATQPVGRDALASELARLDVRELLLPRDWEEVRLDLAALTRTYRDPWRFDPAIARDELIRHFRVQSLEGFGVRADASEDALAVAAAGALLSYLREVQPVGVSHLRPPRIERGDDALVLDEMTRRNLELVEPLRRDVDAPSLLDVLEETLTPMGARMMRTWLLRPLADGEPIRRRHEAVEELFEDRGRREAIRRVLRAIGDLERLSAKAAARRATPRDLLALGNSLGALPRLKAALGEARAPLLERAAGLDLLEDVADLLHRALDPETPASVGEGGVIREGYCAELDDLRRARDGAVDFIAALQTRERERTGIPSLKVGYNKVFGYYLEVTRPNLDRVPPDYERRQTLAGAERFVTPELREWESKVLSAEERIGELEERIYREVRDRVGAEVARIQSAAECVAEIDVFAALAHVAEARAYVRPQVDDGDRIEIEAGRHPVVETTLPRGAFVPNDVVLDGDERIMILTGPNMAGKSTVLRQVGLIVVMAQMGSFVPATRARIGIVDRLFTRVGASDNLAGGRSTFMVEMIETAAILNGATERSLILLDEIGRGTSTYDGVSIAWAVTEYIHERVGAKAIFATHYHELTQITQLLPAAVAYNVAVKEMGDEVVFLRRLARGSIDRSYGIHVARLAGLPGAVVARAREVLRELEGARGAAVPILLSQSPHAPRTERAAQLSLFVPVEHDVVRRLRELDTARLTPLDALHLLESLRRAVTAAGEQA